VRLKKDTELCIKINRFYIKENGDRIKDMEKDVNTIQLK